MSFWGRGKRPREEEEPLDDHERAKQRVRRLVKERAWKKGLGKNRVTADKLEQLFEEVDAIYEELDVNNDGVLSRDEFTTGLIKLRFPLPMNHVEEIWTKLDYDRNNIISREEFYRYAYEQQQRILECWDKLDYDKDMQLNVHEIAKYFASQGQNVPEYQIRKFISTVNRHAENGNGHRESQHKHNHKCGDEHIDFDAFRNWVFLSPSLNFNFVFETFEESVTSIDSAEPTPDIADVKYRFVVFGAGAISGTVSRTLTAPADRLKVMYQAGGTFGDAGGVHGKSIPQLTKELYREGGWRAFWRGNGANVVKIAPENATKFFMYEYAKTIICENPRSPTSAERFWSGACAGATAQASIYPLEICKTRLALGTTGELNGIVGTTASIMRNEGIRGLYRGLGASVLGIVPYAGTDLAVYNTLREWYKPEEQDPTVLMTLSIGAFASICGQLVSYPLQLVRTKLQAAGRATHDIREPPTIRTILTGVVKKHGILGLYTGISCNFMKSVPAVAITYVVYEKSRTWLRNKVYNIS